MTFKDSDVIKEPNDEKRTRYISVVSATKRGDEGDGTAWIEVRFWGHKEKNPCEEHDCESEVPEQLHAFLAVLET